MARRDFTVNSLALHDSEIIDLFGGQDDLKNTLIRAVGNPAERFDEDALRIMRAIRLSSELDFEIEEKTFSALKEKAHLLKLIAMERIREEFSKTLMSDTPSKAIEKMRELGILKIFLPELEEGWEVGQNKHHIYTVWDHNINALKHAFPDGKQGKIVVEYSVSKGGWKLMVSDNGVGIVVVPTRKGSLGTIIVQSLARQLGATVERKTSPKGTLVSIEHSLMGVSGMPLLTP